MQLHVAHDVHRAQHRRRAPLQAQAFGGLAGGIHRDHHHVPVWFAADFAQERAQAAGQVDGFLERAQAQVVGQPAIGEMHVVPLLLVRVAAQAFDYLLQLRRILRRLRQVRRGAPAVVLQHHRLEQHRHRRRCRHRIGQRVRAQVRAQQVEEFLQEGEADAAFEVGGVDHDQRAIAPLQVGEGGALEDGAVVQGGGRVAAAFRREPAARAQDPVQHVRGQVAAQEAGLEIAEGVVAVQAVIGGGEAAAGDRADRIDFIQQSPVAVRADAGIAQFQQHTIRQRRGARPAAGEGQHQGDVVAASGARGFGHAVSRLPCRRTGQWLVVDPAVGGAARQQHRQQAGQQTPGRATAQTDTPNALPISAVATIANAPHNTTRPAPNRPRPPATRSAT